MLDPTISELANEGSSGGPTRLDPDWILEKPSRVTLSDTTEFIREGRARLALSGTEDPETVVRTVNAYLRSLSRDGTEPLGDPIILPELGSVLGDAIRRETGWRWMDAVAGSQRRRVIASPDGAYGIDPYGLLHRGWQESGQGSEILLVFALLRSGNLPPAIAGRTQLLA